MLRLVFLPAEVEAANNSLCATGNVCFNQCVQFFHILSTSILISQLVYTEESREGVQVVNMNISVLSFEMFLCSTHKERLFRLSNALMSTLYHLSSYYRSQNSQS